MLIGGCTFSMAGGIRVSRIITFAQVTKNSIVALLLKEQAITKPARHNDSNNIGENFSSISILLFTFTLVVLAILFTTIGVSFKDALFEVGSAITTADYINGCNNSCYACCSINGL